MTLPRIDHVAIVGAGFSGTLQAINLLRHDGPRVTLIERRPVVARGTAYSTLNPAHLLNVRAANMSALPDDPDHFVRWQATQGASDEDGFALRRDYGNYLAGLLEDARRRASGRLVLRREAAAEVVLSDDRVEVVLEAGERIAADVAVLALGNLPPHDPGVLAGAALPPELYVSDPWTADLAGGLRDVDEVLILGTGLTMVDVVLALDAAHFQGRITALSRRGLVPRSHGPAEPPTHLPQRPTGPVSTLLRAARLRTGEIGWRAAIDELRPYTRGIWVSASLDEQRRFLRHLRPFWDVHRHRLAPAVARRLGELTESGRLAIVAGRLTDCAVREDALHVRWCARRSGRAEHRQVQRIINCTGPQGDLLRSREPLLHLLLASGTIRPDVHRFGIDVNRQAETIDVRSNANPRLFALGPMTRGTFWETVAVPDIRRQTWDMARRLAKAQWVEGEGL